MNKALKTQFVVIFVLSVLIFPIADSISAEETKHQTTITYTVKKGDTLWGLSKKFFDSPWYWPGLWAENTEIPNPHWIYPGQQITLYNKNAVSDISVKQKKPVPQVIKQIKKEEKIEEKKPSFVYRKINKLPFIAKKKIKPDGIIKKGVTPLEMFSTTDEIYIIAQNGADKFLIGEKYAIYKQPFKVQDPEKRKVLLGYQYNLAGVIEILKKEGRLLRAVITNTYRPISKGDLITEFHEIKPDIFLRPSVAGLNGRIIKEKEGGIYLGEKFVGFIDAGTADGVERGQIYSLVEEQQIDIGKKEKIKELIPFGSFVVLEAREETSSVLIIDAEKQIPVGTKFISPVM